MPSIRPGDHRNTLPNIEGGPWNAKYVAEALSELVQLAGYDLFVDPVEAGTTYWNMDVSSGTPRTAPANVPRIGRLRIATPAAAPDPNLSGGRALGNDPPVFEYGTTRSNVSSYSLRVDRDEQANQIFVPRVGFPEPGYLGTQTTSNKLDTTTSNAFGRLQAWVEPGDIYLQATRDSLAQVHLDLRKGPRRRVTFQPSRNNVIQPFVHYKPGSWVRFRALNGTQLRFDLMVRIWAINVSIDDNGNESVTLETVEGGG